MTPLLLLFISMTSALLKAEPSNRSGLSLPPYQVSSCPIESKPAGIDGGDFTPFPWGNEIPIAHSALRGIWTPTSIECGTYFAFEINSHTAGSQRIVTVMQFDPETCTVLSSGVGYEFEKVFYVSMVGPNGRAYDLTIRAFNKKDLKPSNSGEGEDLLNPPSLPRSRPYIVATLYPRKEWSKRISYPLIKTSSYTQFNCSNGDALPRSRYRGLDSN